MKGIEIAETKMPVPLTHKRPRKYGSYENFQRRT